MDFGLLLENFFRGKSQPGGFVEQSFQLQFVDEEMFNYFAFEMRTEERTFLLQVNVSLFCFEKKRWLHDF